MNRLRQESQFILMNKQQLQRIDCMRDIEKVRRFFEGDRYAVEVTGVKIDEVDDCYSKCSLDLDKRDRKSVV